MCDCFVKKMWAWSSVLLSFSGGFRKGGVAEDDDGGGRRFCSFKIRKRDPSSLFKEEKTMSFDF